MDKVYPLSSNKCKWYDWDISSIYKEFYFMLDSENKENKNLIHKTKKKQFYFFFT